MDSRPPKPGAVLVVVGCLFYDENQASRKPATTDTSVTTRSIPMPTKSVHQIVSLVFVPIIVVLVLSLVLAAANDREVLTIPSKVFESQKVKYYGRQ
jgi:hypothetical protein